MTSRALLLLDFQVDFLDPGGRLPIPADLADALIRAGNRMLADHAAQGAPVAVVFNAFPARDIVGNWFRRQAAVEGTPGARIDPRLRVAPTVPRLPKSKSSAFSNPTLEPFLRSQGAAALIVCGVFAEGCVRATALDALRRGFRVQVPSNLVASNASWKTGWALRVLRRAGVDTTPWPTGAAET